MKLKFLLLAASFFGILFSANAADFSLTMKADDKPYTETIKDAAATLSQLCPSIKGNDVSSIEADYQSSNLGYKSEKYDWSFDVELKVTMNSGFVHWYYIGGQKPDSLTGFIIQGKQESLDFCGIKSVMNGHTYLDVSYEDEPKEEIKQTQFGDWFESPDFPGSYMSFDIVGQVLTAMVKPKADGTLNFGIYFLYDGCYVDEDYSKPFGQILVLGQPQDFRLQCLGKKKSIIYASNPDVTQGIVDTLLDNGNVCMTPEGAGTNKMCFSGTGLKEIKALQKK
ncbi:MAG: hypothetical protein ACK5MF_06090 [Vibrio sp.]|uniref:hypothetical protein n=1 Tax=Vibrio sp. TaxID=678 RepID=UPI003A8B1B6C